MMAVGHICKKHDTFTKPKNRILISMRSELYIGLMLRDETLIYKLNL